MVGAVYNFIVAGALGVIIAIMLGMICKKCWEELCRHFRGVSLAGFMLSALVALQVGGSKNMDTEGDPPEENNGLLATGYFPLYSTTIDDGGEGTVEVTNLCFTGIKPTSTSVALKVAWPMSMAISALDVFASVQSVSNWQYVGTAEHFTTNAVRISVPYQNLMTNVIAQGGMLSNGLEVAFFQVATQHDSDNDGLSDIYERYVVHTNPNLADTDGE